MIMKLEKIRATRLSDLKPLAVKTLVERVVPPPAKKETPPVTVAAFGSYI